MMIMIVVVSVIVVVVEMIGVVVYDRFCCGCVSIISFGELDGRGRRLVDHFDELSDFECKQEIGIAFEYARKQLIGQLNGLGQTTV